MKTPLLKMITLWQGIADLHNSDLSAAKTAQELSRADRLKAKAQAVAAAMTHYQIELET